MSETTNLKLLKHDNPSTNADEFDIENYLNGNLDKIDENVGKTNTTIEILEKELKEAQEDFYQNSIRGQTTGEYIHVEDSSGARCIIGISGNSEQGTRSGKNKFIPLPTGANSGLTITKNEDGTYNISGTATANIEHTAFIDLDLSEIKNGSTYIVSTTKTLPEGLSSRVEMYNETRWLRQFIPSINSTTLTNTGTADTTDTTRIRFGIFATSGAKIDIQNVGFQLEEGTVVTEYEQYGVSPSPDYPSEIKSVGSNVNIFDKDNMTIGKIWSGATLLDSDVGNASPKIPVTAGKTYTRNAGYSSNYIIKEDNSVVDIQGGTNAITMPEDTKYWMFNIPKDIDINTIKAEEGSISTPQSKYGQGCITEVICNSILDNVTMEQGAISANVGKDYTSTKVDSSTRIRTTNLIKLDVSKTYTMNFNTKYNVVIQAFNDSKQLYSVSDNIANSWHLNSFSFSGYPYIAISVRYNNNTSKITPAKIEDIKLILSDKIQTYIMPTQQPMRSIGNIRDTFVKVNGKWYERHYIYRNILNGKEPWTSPNSNTYPNLFDYNPSISDIRTNLGNVQNSKCSHFIWRDVNDVRANEGHNIYVSKDTLRFRICNSNVTTLEDFKEWLATQYNAGTPVYIDYIQQIPTDIECTEEQSKVLDELNNARTYKNTTNIYSTDEINPIIDLDYVKYKKVDTWIDYTELQSYISSSRIELLDGGILKNNECAEIFLKYKANETISGTNALAIPKTLLPIKYDSVLNCIETTDGISTTTNNYVSVLYYKGTSANNGIRPTVLTVGKYYTISGKVLLE